MSNNTNYTHASNCGNNASNCGNNNTNHHNTNHHNTNHNNTNHNSSEKRKHQSENSGTSNSPNKRKISHSSLNQRLKNGLNPEHYVINTQHILADIDLHPFNQHSDYTTNHKCVHTKEVKHKRTHHLCYTCTFTSGFSQPIYVCPDCIGETEKLTNSDYSVVSSTTSHHCSQNQLPMRMHQEKKEEKIQHKLQLIHLQQNKI